MSCQVNIAEAKAKLSELLDRALAGEEIVIARAGKPLARLVPVEELKPREPGAWSDWQVPDDVFLEPMDPETSTPPKASSATNSALPCRTSREAADRHPCASVVAHE